MASECKRCSLKEALVQLPKDVAGLLEVGIEVSSQGAARLGPLATRNVGHGQIFGLQVLDRESRGYPSKHPQV